jgi:predicted phage tail protein
VPLPVVLLFDDEIDDDDDAALLVLVLVNVLRAAFGLAGVLISCCNCCTIAAISASSSPSFLATLGAAVPVAGVHRRICCPHSRHGPRGTRSRHKSANSFACLDDHCNMSK